MIETRVMLLTVTENPFDTASRRWNVALALQGGGSHRAFTWGVLDRLLEERSINVIGVTGTSACALFVLVKTNHLMHLRIAEYVSLIAMADVTGHFGVGESKHALKLAA